MELILDGSVVGISIPNKIIELKKILEGPRPIESINLPEKNTSKTLGAE
jgi:hypothetical protein